MTRNSLLQALKTTQNMFFILKNKSTQKLHSQKLIHSKISLLSYGPCFFHMAYIGLLTLWTFKKHRFRPWLYVLSNVRKDKLNLLQQECTLIQYWDSKFTFDLENFWNKMKNKGNKKSKLMGYFIHRSCPYYIVTANED